MKNTVHITTFTRALFIALISLQQLAVAQSATFKSGSEPKFNYKDTQDITAVNKDIHRINTASKDTHVKNDARPPQSAPEIKQPANSDVKRDDVKNDTHAKTSEIYKDTHDKPNELSASSKTLTQVPYAALGVLPTREHDELFSYGESPLQSVYVWHGRNTKHDKLAGKAVVFVHGGCWLNAYGYDHASGFYKALADLGMGVFVMEYRRVGDKDGGWPGSLNDVTEAMITSLERIRGNGRYSKVYIAGHSAGGHLAMLAAQKLPQFTQSVSVEKVIGLAAITDINAYAVGANSCQTATAKFMHSMPDENPEAYQAATPNAKLINTPIVLMQGDADSIVPKLHATMAGAKQKIITNGGHFDWLHPDSTSFDALLEVIGEHD